MYHAEVTDREQSDGKVHYNAYDSETHCQVTEGLVLLGILKTAKPVDGLQRKFRNK